MLWHLYGYFIPFFGIDLFLIFFFQFSIEIIICRGQKYLHLEEEIIFESINL